MHAAWYERCGPANEVLTVGEMEAPRPGPGEVLVRLRASGINPGDAKKRADWMGFGIGYARVIPHSDGAGTIEEVGAGVGMSRSVWAALRHSRRVRRVARRTSGDPARRSRLRGWGLPRHPRTHGISVRLRRWPRGRPEGAGRRRGGGGGKLRRLVRPVGRGECDHHGRFG